MLTSYHLNTINLKITLAIRIKQSNCYSNLAVMNFLQEEHYLQERYYLKKITSDFLNNNYIVARTGNYNCSEPNHATTECFLNEIKNLNELNLDTLNNHNILILIDQLEWLQNLSSILNTNLVTNIYIIRHEGDFKLQHSLNIDCDCDYCLFNSMIKQKLPFKFDNFAEHLYNSGFQYSMLKYILQQEIDPNSCLKKDKFCKKYNHHSKNIIYPKLDQNLVLHHDPYATYKKLGEPKYIAAPMVGQSELAFRMMVRNLGVNLCYTPMINAQLFVDSQEYRDEMLTLNKDDRPLAVQFAANNPTVLLAAAKLIDPDQIDLIDINLGCPQPIARRHGYGAWLMEYPFKIYDLIRVLKENLSTPISCKIRIFESLEQSIKYARMLENAGCSLLTVHGRLRKSNMNTESADWLQIKAIKENLNIPVIANGSINNLEQAEECLSITNCDGVMAASHLLENPYLFTGKIHHPQDLALEYLEYAEKYSALLNYATTHVLQITQKYLIFQYQEKITQAKSIQELKNYLKKLSKNQFNLDPNIKNKAIDLVALPTGV